MIRLQRSRDAASLGTFTGAKLQQRLQQLETYYYDDADAARAAGPPGAGKVDFKPKARQIWSAAKPALKQDAAGKCAYCEADTAVVAHGDVEHFRPKDLYWWLAYCVDNYTFSCQICNQTYKSNQFPVTGARLKPPRMPAARPTDPAKAAALAASFSPDPATATLASLKRLFGAENAHLPDPYIDDPEKLFAWHAIETTKEVWLVARGRSARAKAAVKAAEEVLGLNRTELLRLRWNHYDLLQTLALAFQTMDHTSPNAARVLDGIRRQAAPSQPFAAMTRHWLRTWGLLD